MLVSASTLSANVAPAPVEPLILMAIVVEPSAMIPIILFAIELEAFSKYIPAIILAASPPGSCAAYGRPIMVNSPLGVLTLATSSLP